MNDQNNKVKPEETPKDEKIELTDEEADAVAGGKVMKVTKPNNLIRR